MHKVIRNPHIKMHTNTQKHPSISNYKQEGFFFLHEAIIQSSTPNMLPGLFTNVKPHTN